MREIKDYVSESLQRLHNEKQAMKYVKSRLHKITNGGTKQYKEAISKRLESFISLSFEKDTKIPLTKSIIDSVLSAFIQTISLKNVNDRNFKQKSDNIFKQFLNKTISDQVIHANLLIEPYKWL